MNFEYKHLLNNDFDPASRVWVYQSSRLFTISEALQIEEMIDQFAHNLAFTWSTGKSHRSFILWTIRYFDGG